MFYYLVKSYNIIDVLKPSEEEAEKYSKMSGEKLTQILLDNGYTYPPTTKGCYWLGAKFDGEILWGGMK